MSEVATVQPAGALAHAGDTGSMLSIIARAASDPAVDVQKMTALLDMQERILAKQAEAAFNGALARLSAHMPRVSKKGTIKLVTKEGVDKGSIPFARWEDVDSVIRPLMRQEGFTLSFNAQPRTGEGGGAVVSGTLLHAEGHSRTVSIPLALDSGAGRNNLQAMGSTLSYGKRYCAEMLLNIVREGADDDGATGGAEFITPDQAAHIISQIRALGVVQEKFLAMLKAPTVEQISTENHEKALHMLAMKRRQVDAEREQRG